MNGFMQFIYSNQDIISIISGIVTIISGVGTAVSFVFLRKKKHTQEVGNSITVCCQVNRDNLKARKHPYVGNANAQEVKKIITKIQDASVNNVPNIKTESNKNLVEYKTFTAAEENHSPNPINIIGNSNNINSKTTSDNTILIVCTFSFLSLFVVCATICIVTFLLK